MAQRQIARGLLGLSVSLRPSSRILSRTLAATSYRSQLVSTSMPVSASIHTSAPHFNKHIINIQDEADFKTRVIESETPVVVDFHAGWCGPCKLLGPRLETMIADRAGKVILAKVDIDENADLAMGHGVEAVPTVLGVKDGKVVEKFVGLKDDAAIESFLDKLAPQ